MKIISVLNQKGGSGKTTIATNLKEVIDTKMDINSNITKSKTKEVVKAFAVNKQILIEAKKYSLEP